MTRAMIMTPSYSMKNFTVKTFMNCPETTTFTKVLTFERFPLYGIKKTTARIRNNFACTNYSLQLA